MHPANPGRNVEYGDAFKLERKFVSSDMSVHLQRAMHTYVSTLLECASVPSIIYVLACSHHFLLFKRPAEGQPWMALERTEEMADHCDRADKLVCHLPIQCQYSYNAILYRPLKNKQTENHTNALPTMPVCIWRTLKITFVVNDLFSKVRTPANSNNLPDGKDAISITQCP